MRSDFRRRAALALALVTATTGCVETLAYADRAEPLADWLCGHSEIAPFFESPEPVEQEGTCHFVLREKTLLCSDPAGRLAQRPNVLTPVGTDGALLAVGGLTEGALIIDLLAHAGLTDGQDSWVLQGVSKPYDVSRIAAVAGPEAGGYTVGMVLTSGQVEDARLALTTLFPERTRSGTRHLHSIDGGSRHGAVFPVGEHLCAHYSQITGDRLARLSGASDSGTEVYGTFDSTNSSYEGHAFSRVNGANALVTVGTDCRVAGEPYLLPEHPITMARQTGTALGIAAGMTVVEVLESYDPSVPVIVRQTDWKDPESAAVITDLPFASEGGQVLIRFFEGHSVLVQTDLANTTLTLTHLNFDAAAEPRLSRTSFAATEKGTLKFVLPQRQSDPDGRFILFVGRAEGKPAATDRWRLTFDLVCDAS